MIDRRRIGRGQGTGDRQQGTEDKLGARWPVTGTRQEVTTGDRGQVVGDRRQVAVDGRQGSCIQQLYSFVILDKRLGCWKEFFWRPQHRSKHLADFIIQGAQFRVFLCADVVAISCKIQRTVRFITLTVAICELGYEMIFVTTFCPSLP